MLKQTKVVRTVILVVMVAGSLLQILGDADMFAQIIDTTGVRRYTGTKNDQDLVSTPPLQTMRVASGLSKPLFVTAPPGDTLRLFIVEQKSGCIKILTGGVVLPVPFLDISHLITTGGSEQGLLGLAFHPDYLSNGYFFVNYTDTLGNTNVARYKVSGNPEQAEPDSQFILLDIAQPFANHNGGMLAFSPSDGYLYIGMGDGGSAGDPGNRAQDDGELLGKILRIDVNGPSPYSIPPDNPFVGAGDPLDEIWAKGFRNPWRFSFDRVTHNLYVGDVGQDSFEEIDFQPSSSTGGENYGWRLMEGDHCYNPPTNCDPGGLTYPIHVYTHGGSPSRCSITGGYVYRGEALSGLQGTYFFGDYCSGQIWSFRYDGNNVTEYIDRTAELAPGDGMSIDQISSFGEDGAGELYIVDLDGEVYQITNVQGFHPISIIDFAFLPQTDTIAIGDSVRWTNNGAVPHSATSDTKGLWDSGTLNPGESFIFRFNLSGSYPYHCEFYPSMTGTVVVQSTDVTHETSVKENPSKFDLSQNYPNPFNPITTIKFKVQGSRFKVPVPTTQDKAVDGSQFMVHGPVPTTLKIYNILGEVVRTLVDQPKWAGNYSVQWDGKNDKGEQLSSGVYFYQLKAGEYTSSKKMVLIK